MDGRSRAQSKSTVETVTPEHTCNIKDVLNLTPGTSTCAGRLISFMDLPAAVIVTYASVQHLSFLTLLPAQPTDWIVTHR